jgi:hypothetical protein
MILTEDTVREFGSMAILHKKRLSKDFQKAHVDLNNQHTIAVNTISEFNFFLGQEYAYLKILKYLQGEG